MFRSWTRKVIKVGNSLAVTIPQEIVKEYHLKAGDEPQTYCDGDTFVIILPTKNVHRRTATNEEVASKFQELEKRYGKLYQDLAGVKDLTFSLKKRHPEK